MNRAPALIVIAVLVAACSMGSPSQARATIPGSAPALTRAASALPLDTPLKHCLGDTTSRSAVFRIDDGLQFWQVVPGLLKSPELTEVTEPLVVVVYSEGWPGMVTGTLGGSPPTHRPGTWDICVEVASGANQIAGAPFIVYTNVSPDGAEIPTP